MTASDSPTAIRITAMTDEGAVRVPDVMLIERLSPAII
jgi:hypothetical protein